MWPAIIGGIAGLLTGVVGALFAPWVQGKLERDNELSRQRVARVEEWRQGFAAAAEAERVESKACLADPWYLSLRPYLTDSERAQLEAGTGRWTATLVVDGEPGRWGDVAALLLNAIDRIARTWDVV